MSELLTKYELANRLRVSAVTVRRWAYAGVIPEVFISERMRRYDPDAVVEALKKRGKDLAARRPK